MWKEAQKTTLGDVFSEYQLTSWDGWVPDAGDIHNLERKEERGGRGRVSGPSVPTVGLSHLIALPPHTWAEGCHSHSPRERILHPQERK